MPDSRLPKQLLVFAPVEGAQSVGEQKCHWSDLVHRDQVKYGLKQDWLELAQDWAAWRGAVKMCVDTINKEEQKEDRKKDEKKRTQQSRLTAAMAHGWARL